MFQLDEVRGELVPKEQTMLSLRATLQGLEGECRSREQEVSKLRSIASESKMSAAAAAKRIKVQDETIHGLRSYIVAFQSDLDSLKHVGGFGVTHALTKADTGGAGGMGVVGGRETLGGWRQSAMRLHTTYVVECPPHVLGSGRVGTGDGKGGGGADKKAEWVVEEEEIAKEYTRQRGQLEKTVKNLERRRRYAAGVTLKQRFRHAAQVRLLDTVIGHL
jgi:hypothetical protein